MATRASTLLGTITIGDNIASATNLTSSGSADLVSAATNTVGIIITSLSMSIYENNAPGVLELKVNGSTVMSVVSRETGGTGWGPNAIGGFCSIRIPAGQAVSYTYTEGTNGRADVYITWRLA